MHDTTTTPFFRICIGLFNVDNHRPLFPTGEKVMEPSIETTPLAEEEFQDLGFLGDHVGSGMDERMPTLTATDISSGLDEISRIDKSFRQQSLMMTLDDSSVLGTIDKAERVRLGASEGLLPAEFDTSSMSSPSMLGGGLMSDWDFNAIN
jgi:hypothetical protein